MGFIIALADPTLNIREYFKLLNEDLENQIYLDIKDEEVEQQWAERHALIRFLAEGAGEDLPISKRLRSSVSYDTM